MFSKLISQTGIVLLALSVGMTIRGQSSSDQSTGSAPPTVPPLQPTLLVETVLPSLPLSPQPLISSTDSLKKRRFEVEVQLERPAYPQLPQWRKSSLNLVVREKDWWE